ncbi:MAG: type II toxin-antitoxin system HicB family antitoxin [Candidatus Vogelbacteria bacterium]
MLSQFLAKQLGRAKYKILPDGVYFASIPGLRGVWASASTLENCRTELQSILEDWLLFRLRNRAMIPGLRLPTVSRLLRRPMSGHYA